MSGATLYCLPSNSSRPNAHSVLDTSIGPKSWSLQAACVCVSVSARMYVCVRIQGRVCLSGVVPPTMSCTNGAQPCSPVERSARSEPVALQSP